MIWVKHSCSYPIFCYVSFQHQPVQLGAHWYSYDFSETSYFVKVCTMGNSRSDQMGWSLKLAMPIWRAPVQWMLVGFSNRFQNWLYNENPDEPRSEKVHSLIICRYETVSYIIVFFFSNKQCFKLPISSEKRSCIFFSLGPNWTKIIILQVRRNHLVES